MDVWFFGTICVPMAEMLIATMVQHLVAESPEPNNKTVPTKEAWASKLEHENAKFEKLAGGTGSENQISALKWLRKKVLPWVTAILVAVYFLVGFFAGGSKK